MLLYSYRPQWGHGKIGLRNRGIGGLNPRVDQAVFFSIALFLVDVSILYAKDVTLHTPEFFNS